MGIYTAAVQKLYVAYFNRPADALGLNYWESVVTAAGGSTAAVSTAFAASKEYADTYANMSTAARVDAIYNNLFGRSAEPAGLLFWGQAIDQGKVTVAAAVTAIAAGAQGADKVAYDSKVTAATAFTAALDTSAEIIAYSGTVANNAAKAWMSGIRDVATATAAVVPAVLAASITTVITPPVVVPAGETFTLSTDIEDIDGTAGNDTFTGVVSGDSTAQTGDVVVGGARTDTLRLTVIDDANLDDVSVETNGVEILQVRSLDDAAGDSVQAGLMDGLEQIIAYRSTAAVNVEDIQNSVVLGVVRTDENATFAFANDALDSDDATLALALDGADGITVTVNSGGDDEIHTLVIAASGDDSVVALDIAGDFLESIVINGSASLELEEANDSFDDVTSFNASASSGGVTWASDDEVLEELLGGSGSDTFTVTAAVAEDAVINLGAGNDTLVVGANDLDDAASVVGGAGVDAISSVAIEAGNARVISDFETLILDGETRQIDVALLTKSSIKGLELNAALAGATIIDNLAGTSVTLDINNSGAAAVTFGTLTLTLASSAGTADSLTINMDTDDEDSTVTKLTTTNLEKIVINTDGDGDAGDVNTISAIVENGSTLSTIQILGDQDFTLSDVDTNATAVASTSGRPAADVTSSLTLIDGSTAGGDLIISAGTRQQFADTTVGTFYNVYKGLVIKTGEGDDTVTHSSTSGGVVYTNDGNDTVTLSGSSMTAYLGEGRDGVTVSKSGSTIYAGVDEDIDTVTVAVGAVYTTAAEAFSSSSKFLTISDLASDDVINVTAIEATADDPVDYTDTADDALSLYAAINGALAANVISVFEWSDGNTYLTVNGSVAANSDIVVKIIGADFDFIGTNGVITVG